MICLARTETSTPRLTSRDEQPIQQGAGRTAAAFSRDGGAIVCSAMDVRLLAGMDLPRGLFRRIHCDLSLSDQRGSAASGAADERGPRGREAAGAKDHRLPPFVRGG